MKTFEIKDFELELMLNGIERGFKPKPVVLTGFPINDKLYQYDGNGFVYCIVNLINGKRYCGTTKNLPLIRFFEHIKDSYRTLKQGTKRHLLHNDIFKYGIVNFQLYELETNFSSYKERMSSEAWWQRHLLSRTLEVGYNRSDSNKIEKQEVVSVERVNNRRWTLRCRTTKAGRFNFYYDDNKRGNRQRVNVGTYDSRDAIQGDMVRVEKIRSTL